MTEIQAPTNTAECSRIRKVINRLASAALRDPNAVSDVELAVGEAFSNAVKYGRQHSKISVRVKANSESEMAIEMAYPGSRFDTTITYPEDVHKADGGFGRFIMARVMDSMEYSFTNGHVNLRMTKRRM